MKKLIFVTMLLLLTPSFALAQPSIRFEQTNLDLGTVGQDDTVRPVFEFSNAGDQELVIESVTAS